MGGEGAGAGGGGGLGRADKSVLAALYARSLGGAGRGAEGPCAAAGIARLEKAGLAGPPGAGPGEAAPTELGRASLTVVLAGGVFDIIHPGHIHTLGAARRLGDVLVAVVATDATALRMKKRSPLHAQEQRREMVASLVMVDACLVGDEEDMFRTVARVRPEVVALGYDQAHQEKHIVDGCRRVGLDARVARLQSPVPGISSSAIESEYGDAIHGT